MKVHALLVACRVLQLRSRCNSDNPIVFPFAQLIPDQIFIVPSQTLNPLHPFSPICLAVKQLTHAEQLLREDHPFYSLKPMSHFLETCWLSLSIVQQLQQRQRI